MKKYMVDWKMTRVSRELVANDLYLLRLDDDQTKYFEGLWEIPEGITYNAYLLALPDSHVLFDGWKKDYSDIFLELLGEIVEPRSIDYVVVHHAEPDHTGSLPALLEKAGGRPTIIGHPMMPRLLQGLYGLKGKYRVVKDGETLAMGGETLRFIYAPWLHWPETIVSYLEERRVLLTCDVFGGYSMPEGTVYSPGQHEGYIRSVRKYTINVISHYRRFMERFLDKIEGIAGKASLIAPGHGLLWRGSEDIIGEYWRIASGKPLENKITIVYTSMYGYVEEIAFRVKRLLEDKGYNVTVHGYNDRSRPLLSEAITDVYDSQAVVLATSTYEAGVYPLVDTIVGLMEEKLDVRRPVLLITVYGWGESAGRILRERLEGSGFRVKLYSSRGLELMDDERLRGVVEDFLSQL